MDDNEDLSMEDAGCSFLAPPISSWSTTELTNEVSDLNLYIIDMQSRVKELEAELAYRAAASKLVAVRLKPLGSRWEC